MFRNFMLIVLLIICLITAGCVSNSPQSSARNNSDPVPVSSSEQTTLKIGSLPRIFDLVLYAGQKDGVFTKSNLQVEIITFRSVVERNNAFLAGQLDGFVDSIYEAINLNKENDNCRAVGHNLMPDMFKIIASAASGISSPAQLKGKDVATSTATIMEYGLDTLLASEGINAKEVNYVNVPNMPLRLEMMAQGKLAAAILTPPLSEQAIANGNRMIKDDSQQLLAGPALIFSNGSLKSKPDSINRFIQSWQESVNNINTNPEKYRSLLVSTAQVPDPLAASYQIPVFPRMRLPTDGEINVLVNWMKAKGMITREVPYELVVESRYFN